jgi:MFS family permease
VTDWEQYGRDHRRKERKEGVKLLLLGIAFVALGVFVLAIGGLWLGLVGICFGLMGVLTGTSQAATLKASTNEALLIAACVMFAACGALMILSGVLAPEQWGWRGGLSAVIAGSLCLAFFGPGAVLLIIRRIRRRRSGDSWR